MALRAQDGFISGNRDSLSRAKRAELVTWLTQAVLTGGELDSRNGTIWMQPQLYPDRKQLFEDFQADQRALVSGMQLDPNNAASKPVSQSLFYQVCPPERRPL